MPTCPICSKEMKYINNSHLKSHGLTPTQFKEMYPGVEAMSEDVRDVKKVNGLKGAITAKKSQEAQYEKRSSKYNSNPKKCLKCNSVIPYEKRINKFCSHSCSASTMNKNRTIHYSEDAKRKLKELGAKIPRKYGWSTYEKKCIICNEAFFVDWIKKSKKTCSDKCRSKAHALNNYKKDITFGKWGYYQGIYCASSWELAFLIYNKDLKKDIQRCRLTFDYRMNDEDKTYFPDFLIDAIIYEVKGRELEDVALKTQAVIDAGYQIELIRKKEITPIIKFLKEKYKVKDLTELYDKKD
jgi:predicted nucleic acid-binding Zn ribbon protein